MSILPDQDKYPKQAGVNHLKEFLDAWKDKATSPGRVPTQPEAPPDKPVDGSPGVLEKT